MFHKLAALAFAFLLAGCGDGFEIAQPPEQQPEQKPLRCAAGTPAVTIHQTLFATYANPMIVVDSADFDGANDYMTRGAGLTGAADSKTGIISGWFVLDDITNLQELISTGTATPHFWFIFASAPTSKFRVIAYNGAGSFIFQMSTSSAFSAGATWVHVLASWDLAASATHLYINDVSNKSADTVTNDTIDYTYANWSIGADVAGGNKFNGCLSELYFSPGQYLDFSLVYNRRKFISASGKPVFLGTDGSFPTGTAPLVYQHLGNGEAVANFATNRGTGGDFTITGTLATGSTSPSD